MADPIIEFDPASESTGTSLVITTGNYGLIAFDSPAPPEKVQWASSVDTEGALAATVGHENRTVTITVDVTGGTALANLSQKIGKVHREGGTLKYTSPAGTVVIADLLASNDYSPAYDDTRLLGGITTVQFSLPARPYWRGAETEIGTDTVETTLPYLQKTGTGPAGDVPARGRWLIDNDGTLDWWWLAAALETNALYDTTQTSAAQFYEAEGRTALGGSATAVGPTGASGAGSNVMRNTGLTSSYQAILSTQATGGGAHLTHVGTFRVFARVQTPTSNTGSVDVALEWGVGDFLRFTRNEAVTIDSAWEGTWRRLDLGLVTIPKVVQGTQRWEGRIIARSTVASDDIDVDFLFIMPVDTAYGVAQGVVQAPSATTFTARDEFDQTAGALTGKTAPVGGTWVGAGDTDDFTVSGSPTFFAQRAVVTADTANIGRYVGLDVNMTGMLVQADIQFVNTP